MNNLFDHEDESSWYFGAINRQEAQDLLMAEKEGGVFLVRDSTTSVGDFVLCVKPAKKKLEKVIAKYDFESNEKDDLSFKKGDILTVLFKEEEQWWRAKDKNGREGCIPVPYVQKVQLEESSSPVDASTRLPEGPVSSIPESKPKPKPRKLPAKARVKQVRVPNAYDDTALKLEVGDIIIVTKTNINGQWEGELNGKVGYFPFTHVEFLDDDSGS
ncbi:hypothetical protein D910_02660 [Dendroctonus ponderosae]|uniref:SH3 domain-containing protein n=1 Tax=Dendroctonus ponderosae TaxID=77166 RepID=U4TUK4_DENPD|nr:hypothetical protein D910_02660 [Dendroctonus ponderosae]